jgi:hypothetical protein
MNPILGIVASSISGNLSTNSYESIQTVTVGSGGQSSITFSSIPATFKHLQIRGIGRSADTGTNDVTGYLRFNSDTASNYSSHRLYGYGSSAGADSAVSAAQISFATVLANGNAASCFSGIVCDILDYTNTNKYKTTRSLAGGETNSLGMMFVTSGNWRDTSAVSSITLTNSGGNWVQYSSFALYGIRG